MRIISACLENSPARARSAGVVPVPDLRSCAQRPVREHRLSLRTPLGKRGGYTHSQRPSRCIANCDFFHVGQAEWCQISLARHMHAARLSQRTYDRYAWHARQVCPGLTEQRHKAMILIRRLTDRILYLPQALLICAPRNHPILNKRKCCLQVRM